MVKKISLDFETYSEVAYSLGAKVIGQGSQNKGGLPVSGSAAYAEHPSTDILSLAYQLDDGPELLWVPGSPDPVDLLQAVRDGAIFTAWNVTFEFLIWHFICAKRFKWPALSLSRCTCMMAASRRFSYPGALALAAKVAGTAPKDEQGSAVMRRLSRPHTPTKKRDTYRIQPWDEWPAFEKLYAYNIQDVIAERSTAAKIPPLSPFEREVWLVDQRINLRGVQVDTDALAAALDVLEQAELIYTAQLVELTNGKVNSIAEIDNFKDWINDQSSAFFLENMQKETIEQALETDQLTPEVRTALELRQALGSSNVKKLYTLKQQLSSDGRLRCQYTYCGADRTGRWCLTGDHEVLTPEGWVRLDQWGGGSLLCWQPNGDMFFDMATPNQFDYSGPMNVWGGRRFQQVATPDHTMPAITEKGDFKAVKASECITTYRHPRAGFLAPSSRYTADEIRFFIMVQADGHITEKSVRLKFVKRRKINRCRSILRALNIQHRERVNGDLSVAFDVAFGYLPKHLNIMGVDKTLPAELLICDHDLFFNELAHWDSSVGGPNSLQYSTTNKANADLVQAKAHISGRSCNIREKHTDALNWSKAYYCHIWEAYTPTHGRSIKKTEVEYSGQVYCPTTSTGFFLVRRNGVAWITGNTSGGVQLQNLTSAGPKVSRCNGCGAWFGSNIRSGSCGKCGNFVDFEECKAWNMEASLQAIETIRSRSFDRVRNRWADVVKTLAGCIRGMFIPKPGHMFVIVDYSSIEAVVLACLARCQWRIDVFKTHGKIYEMSAAAITGKPFEFYLDYRKEHGEHHVDRKKIGKIAELACFSGETEVLTRRGYVRIDSILPNDELWDGVQWVKHGGLVNKGERLTLNLAGVQVTPNHPIYTGGSWKAARLLASNENMMTQALAIGSANLPSLESYQGGVIVGQLYGANAGPSPIGSRLTHYVREVLQGATCAPNKNQKRRMSKYTPNTPTYYPTMNTAGASLTGYAPPVDVAKMKRTRASKTTGRAELKSLNAGKVKKASGRFCDMFKRSKVGTSLASKWTGRTSIKATNRAISVLFQGRKTSKTGEVSRKCKAELMNSNVVYDIVNAGPLNRFTIKTDRGPLIVHNSGFGGWINAWRVFGADQSDEEIKAAILAWRAASPEIVEFWGGQYRQVGPKLRDAVPELFGLEGMAIAAILNPGNVYTVNDIKLTVQNDILYMRLPSGRCLHYHRPRLANTQDRLGRGPAYKITFEGFNSNSQKGPVGWHRMETFGGRLAENATQAVARDIQAEGMVRCEYNGFPVVMHTHDEIIGEVPVYAYAEPEHAVDAMSELMLPASEWCSWYPLRAAGWTAFNYGKDD